MITICHSVLSMDASSKKAAPFCGDLSYLRMIYRIAIARGT